ncbi:hypothetical protein Mpt1_c13250 [Candidatus Methanoplasma termitum]|uniref:DUF998 domain-containing protein n=1 Tax=Candidatus Methanoplasma termitum TaxID=1577791 RepID=A0A0A7LFY6_9ARCH|nr:DUF998 domain-containing protein [Candidatus Methanoplasma termitum]AIZ57187.1 hypothetical protein Mpt1_c13250 [Candidatus Methanoplasma termitum]MCL2334191.1 DUF998 domain-containing protein [Candidatus Methanoplasma sp.]
MKVSKDRSIAFAWFGFIGVAAFIIAWICADSIDTAWQFGVNNLSDLGVSDTDAKLYFNYGCIIAGILLAIMGVGRVAYAKNAGHIAGGVLIVFGSVAFALVGWFTADDGDLHKFIATCAALFIFLAMIAVAAGNWAADRKIFAGVSIIIVFLLAAMFFAYDTAGLEAYGIILAGIWFITESVNMIVSSRKG